MPARDFQLSMGQMAEVVLYGALAAFAVTPLVRTVQLVDTPAPLPMLTLIGGMVVALVWALCLRLTARGRPLRFWLSNVCLVLFFGLSAIPCTALAGYLWYAALRGATPGALMVVPFSVLAVLLAVLLVVLVRHLYPRSCPSCGRSGLIPDARRAAGEPDPVRGLWPAAWCLRCGARARRLTSGWTADDPLEQLRRPIAPRAGQPPAPGLTIERPRLDRA